MMEHYNRSRTQFHYQLTPQSFAIVANTFAMKVPMPAEAAVRLTVGLVEAQVKPDSMCTESKGETGRTWQGLLLRLAGIAVVLTMAAQAFGELNDALRTYFCKDEHK